MVKPDDPSNNPIFRTKLKRTTNFFHKGDLVTDLDIPTFLNKGSVVETVLYPYIWIHNNKFGCSFYCEKVNKTEGPARGVWGDVVTPFVCVKDKEKDKEKEKEKENEIDTAARPKYDGQSSKKRCMCEAGLDPACLQVSWP
jgi:hypothetical protein